MHAKSGILVAIPHSEFRTPHSAKSDIRNLFLRFVAQIDALRGIGRLESGGVEGFL